MANRVALLRAINLAGRNKVGMADLRTLVEGLGFQDVRTLLQSGNLLFGSNARTGAQLERLLEQELQKALGFQTDFFVRSAKEWNAIVAGNPFPDQARRDPGHLLVMCLKDAPNRTAIAALEQAIQGRETIHVQDRHAYIVYPDGVGRSKLTNGLIEKKLQTRGTGRNWNTVLKIGAMLDT